MAVSKFRAKLHKIGRTQGELLLEIQKNGYPKLNIQQLSAYGVGTVTGPQAEAVTKLAYRIIDEWSRQRNTATDDLKILSKRLIDARTERMSNPSTAEGGPPLIDKGGLTEKAVALKLARRLIDEYAPHERRKAL